MTGPRTRCTCCCAKPISVSWDDARRTKPSTEEEEDEDEDEEGRVEEEGAGGFEAEEGPRDGGPKVGRDRRKRLCTPWLWAMLLLLLLLLLLLFRTAPWREGRRREGAPPALRVTVKERPEDVDPMEGTCPLVMEEEEEKEEGREETRWSSASMSVR